MNNLIINECSGKELQQALTCIDTHCKTTSGYLGCFEVACYNLNPNNESNLDVCLAFGHAAKNMQNPQSDLKPFVEEQFQKAAENGIIISEQLNATLTSGLSNLGDRIDVLEKNTASSSDITTLGAQINELDGNIQALFLANEDGTSIARPERSDWRTTTAIIGSLAAIGIGIGVGGYYLNRVGQQVADIRTTVDSLATSADVTGAVAGVAEQVAKTNTLLTDPDHGLETLWQRVLDNGNDIGQINLQLQDRNYGLQTIQQLINDNLGGTAGNGRELVVIKDLLRRELVVIKDLLRGQQT